MNETDIRAFQSTHTNWLGKALDVDGDLGPETEWAMAMACLDPRRQEIVTRACSMVGLVEEGGANRGKWIDWVNTRCGQAVGSPWCAAFASWCISVDGCPDVREGSAQQLGRMLRSTTLILPADLMWFATGASTGHCGIVIGLGPGEVMCVEGNHGDGVRITRRLTCQVKIATPLPVQMWPASQLQFPLVQASIVGTR